METKQERSFVRSYLPWLVAAGALAVFLFTLNRALSLTNVGGLARVAGWDWRPVYQAPLYYLLTLPIRWLPQDFQLLASTVFSAVCGALTLALLARTVAILPHDRTREQRLRETHEHGLLGIKTAWIPPLLAVLACGLQMSFWELATLNSGEMLDLLLMAYVIRCLLEYRMSGQDRWLSKMAFVYGLGITTNWAFIGCFPGFVVALAWTMGLRFFHYRFIIRTSLWGLAGLSLYLLLPIIHAWSDPVYGDFFQALRFNLALQKQALMGVPRFWALMAGVVSLLSLLIIGIRWPSSMGDVSPAGFVVMNLLMYVVHGTLFALCLYAALDPAWSPRSLSETRHIGVSFMTYYYFAAVAIGYFCGYFLLLFDFLADRGRERVQFLRQLANIVVTLAVWTVALAAPAALVYKNLPRILMRNSHELESYAKRLADSLPATGCVVLSDDPIRLHSLHAVLGNRSDKFIMLDTASLSERAYHRYLKQRYGGRLAEIGPPPSGMGTHPPVQLMGYLRTVSTRNEICYLHPSFGYYFETFDLVPRGLVYELKPVVTNLMTLPKLPAERLQEQLAFWQKLEKEDLADMAARIGKLTKTTRPYAFNLQWVASWYARACVHWGVALQVNGQAEKAAHYYKLASELSPNNPAAQVNLEWVQHWLKTGKPLDRFSEETMLKLSPYTGNWDLLLSVNGPLDEPTFRLEFAPILARNGLFRAAALEIQRVLAVIPADFRAHLLLANTFVQGNMPERALTVLGNIRKDPAMKLGSAEMVDLVQVEAWAYYMQTNLPKAEALLIAAQEDFHDRDGAFFTLAQMYLLQAEQMRSQGKQLEHMMRMTNALRVFEKQIKWQPQNIPALINLGGLTAQMDDFKGAIAVLSRAIEIDPGNETARLNRAIANLRSERYDDARRDYEYLLKTNPTAYRARFGLAEIAYRRSEWSAALDQYDAYLLNAPPQTSEYFFVQKRIAELKKKVK